MGFVIVGVIIIIIVVMAVELLVLRLLSYLFCNFVAVEKK